MAEGSDERTEAPTPKRRREAREKGNVARSTEINSVLVLLTGLITLRVFSPWMFSQIKHEFYTTYALIENPVMSQTALRELFIHSLLVLGKLILPVVLCIVFIGIVANLMQIGFLLTGKPLVPKFEKLNPLKGLQRMFGMRSLVELVKNLAKVAVVGFVAFLTVKGEFETMTQLSHTSVGAIWVFILQTGFSVVLRVALVLIVIAILDYAYQRYDYEKNLKMSHQEIKEERKQMEGDPKVKSRIRQLQSEMARRRMMQEVPKATVVVTNPTYIAIAIRYEPAEMETPVVLAKGKRVMAQRIKDIAREEKIPIVEDKPLARAMYDKVEPGQQIPIEFFSAVAEILAYVYRLKNKSAA